MGPAEDRLVEDQEEAQLQQSDDNAAPQAAAVAALASASTEWEAITKSPEQEEKDKEKLAAFLKVHGYSAADAKRKVKIFGYKYPLNSAVKANDPEMVRILMEAGADPAAKNSAGQTAKDFASKVDK